MNRHGTPLLIWALVLAAFVVVSPTWAQESSGEEIELRHKGVQKWNLILPNETWHTVSGSVVPVSHVGGQGFAVQPDGMKLLVDNTGNGRPSAVVKGIGGFVPFRAKSEEGGAVEYSARFRKAGDGWQWSTSGVMAGKFKGVPIMLIDANGNGRYDDFGSDAMVVGRSMAAAHLSRVVNIKGDLFEVNDLAEDGSKLTLTPYQGETGTLNLEKGFRARGQLISAVVTHESGDISFDLAGEKRGLVVPIGSYTITGGFAKSGSETCKIRTGKMEPLHVSAEEEAELVWGAPVSIEFDYTLAGGQLTVQPTALHWYGAAGEEYVEWVPDAKSPKILVIDKESGSVVTEGRFGGC